jgi:hypothetical protein
LRPRRDRLPDLEFAIYEKARPDKAAAALAATLLALAQGRLARPFEKAMYSNPFNVRSGSFATEPADLAC